MIRRFARPYAQALLDAADSPAAAAAARDDLRAFHRAMTVAPRLERMAANPAIPQEVKGRAVEAVAAHLGLGELSRRFLRILLDNYRLHRLGEVLEAVEELVNQELGVAVARVTSAEDLDEAGRTRLRQALGELLGKRVELDLEVDPSLMAGFRARVGSVLYDASLEGQLRRLTQTLADA